MNDLSSADVITALEDAGQILVQTTIATLTSQTVFTLSAGSADNDAYNGAFAVIEDATTAAQKAVGLIQDYVGSTKDILLRSDPGIFTMAMGDKIRIIPMTPALPSGIAGSTQGIPLVSIQIPNAPADSAGGLPISHAGGLDLDQIGSETAAILVDTGTTLDGKIDTIDTVVDAVKSQTDKLLFDASNFVKTAVNEIIIAALAKFMTVDSGETTAVAGSVAKIAQGSAGGSVDVASFSGTAKTKVDAIKAKTDMIGSGTVTVTSPVALDQNVTLVKGDDYKAADGRALDFTNAAGTWPDLTGATINFKAAYQLQPTNSFTEATGSVVVASGANQQVRIEIDGPDTTGLPAGSYEYDVEATLSSGNTVTLVSSEGKPDVDLTLLESHAP